MRGEWQPIETAPKNGTEVLVYIPFDGGGCYDLVQWDFEVEAWREDGGATISPKFYAPSHWMALEPPK